MSRRANQTNISKIYRRIAFKTPSSAPWVYDPTLKPCPHCGSTNVAEAGKPSLGIPDSTEYFIMCFDCGAVGESMRDYGNTDNEDNCRYGSVESWNRYGAVSRDLSLLALWNDRDKNLWP